MRWSPCVAMWSGDRPFWREEEEEVEMWMDVLNRQSIRKERNEREMEQKKRRWEVPWSSTVSELLGPAASPPPARGRSALHSGEESDRPVDTNRTVTGTSASYLNPQSLQ